MKLSEFYLFFLFSWGFFSHPICYFSSFYSSSFPSRSSDQTLGHKVGSSPPSPLRCVSCIFIARAVQRFFFPRRLASYCAHTLGTLRPNNCCGASSSSLPFHVFDFFLFLLFRHLRRSSSLPSPLGRRGWRHAAQSMPLGRAGMTGEGDGAAWRGGQRGKGHRVR